MQHPVQPIEVVGAVIVNEDVKVLCALRAASMSLAGFWEFPGGKIDPGESPTTALAREIVEELNCDIEVGELVADCTYAYPNVTIRLRTYLARIVNGQPQPTEHECLTWFSHSELADLNWAPADLPTVKAICGNGI